ncbi:MAG: serine/threonine protein kinase [Myxococcaceae bacterium]|nr:serine/threonine protein kinase [Myxococcaceae bacterium]
MQAPLSKSPEEPTLVEPELLDAPYAGPLPGSSAGRFTLLEIMARGGAGTVFKAVENPSGLQVAVKVLAMPPESRAEVHERFDREIRALQQISHPHIVELYDFGKFEGTGLPYIALEWIEGDRLGKHIREKGPLTLTETWAITQQLLVALTAVHDAGYVHRDVSANNVMLSEVDGRLHVKLIDFGLVKPQPGHYSSVTRPGVIVGTPSVMAPEQFEPPRVDERADIYAVGVLLTFMLTGKNPLQGVTLAEAGKRWAQDRPVHRPSVDVDLHPAVDAVVTRCLEREPSKRFPSAAHLAAELERVIRHAQSSSLRTRAKNVVALCMRARTPSAAADRVLDEMVRVMATAGVERAVKLDEGCAMAMVDAPLDAEVAQSVLAQGTALMERLLAHEPGADVVLTLHTDTVLLRLDNSRVMGGPVLEMLRWPLPEEGTVFVSKQLAKALGPMLAGRPRYGDVTRVV